MNPGFQNKRFLVFTGDGRNVQLAEAELFIDYNGDTYQIPVGATSDGGSTPSTVWGPPLNLPPFGPEWRAYFLHDAAFRNVLLKLVNGEFVLANLTEQQSNDLLWNALLLCLVSRVRAQEILTGLRIGGHPAFVADRSEAGLDRPSGSDSQNSINTTGKQEQAQESAQTTEVPGSLAALQVDREMV